MSRRQPEYVPLFRIYREDVSDYVNEEWRRRAGGRLVQLFVFDQNKRQDGPWGPPEYMLRYLETVPWSIAEGDEMFSDWLHQLDQEAEDPQYRGLSDDTVARCQVSWKVPRAKWRKIVRDYDGNKKEAYEQLFDSVLQYDRGMWGCEPPSFVQRPFLDAEDEYYKPEPVEPEPPSPLIRIDPHLRPRRRIIHLGPESFQP